MKINKIVMNSSIIADDVRVANTIKDRIMGLMFSRKLHDNQALIFVNKEESIRESSLHMLFVFFKIDILWLDSKLEIVDIKAGARPFTPFIKPGKPAKYIIELPNGKINSSKLKMGDRLKFL